MGLDPFSVIGDLVGKVVDLFPNPQDKLKAQELQNQIQLAVNDAQSKLNQEQAQIISAEANSQSWIARNWRPISALTFLALIVTHWFGWSAPGISEAQYLSLFDLEKICLGGYIASRGIEKVADSVSNSFGKK